MDWCLSASSSTSNRRCISITTHWWNYSFCGLDSRPSCSFLYSRLRLCLCCVASDEKKTSGIFEKPSCCWKEGGSGNLGSKRSIDGGACAIWFDIQISSAPLFFLSLLDAGLMDVISLLIHFSCIFVCSVSRERLYLYYRIEVLFVRQTLIVIDWKRHVLIEMETWLSIHFTPIISFWGGGSILIDVMHSWALIEISKKEIFINMSLILFLILTDGWPSSICRWNTYKTESSSLSKNKCSTFIFHFFFLLSLGGCYVFFHV